MDDVQKANWIFAQFGRSRADKVQWLSPIFGKQLACDCGQSLCHAAVLDDLVREMAMSGAIANEGWEFSAASSAGDSIPDSTDAPSVCASYPSSVRNKTQAAWPGSWAELCSEMRSFQFRCVWNMLPDNSVLSQSFKQNGMGCGLVS